MAAKSTRLRPPRKSSTTTTRSPSVSSPRKDPLVPRVDDTPFDAKAAPGHVQTSTSAGTLLNRLARDWVLRHLERIEAGVLEVDEGGCRRRFGRNDGGAGPSISERMPSASARMIVQSPHAYRRFLLAGNLGVAEAYLRQEWTTDDLVGLFRLMARNQSALQKVSGRAMIERLPINTLRRWIRRNTIAGSRHNIREHYDLGNDFFRLFLDPTMTYSSGYFPTKQATMEQASLAKYDQICRRLGVQSGQRIVEIGTGWGGFAIHAARNYGCHVTTTTLSDEQYRFAKRRICEQQLEDRITLLHRDYRELEGSYDGLVSIEMIEAVGHEYLPTFFRKCESLVRPGGAAIYQAITIPDQRYERYRRSVDFIQHYIFPGGCLPSLGAIQRAVGSTQRMRLVALEDFGPHYVQTLRWWRRRFWENIRAVGQLGFDDRFIRMWDYYLAYCEAGFAERMTGVAWLKVDC